MDEEQRKEDEKEELEDQKRDNEDEGKSTFTLLYSNFQNSELLEGKAVPLMKTKKKSTIKM